MTGDRVSAEEAERIGLVNFVVEDAGAAARARHRGAAGARPEPGDGLEGRDQSLIRSIRRACSPPLASSRPAFGSADNREAVAAFNEKRKPNFVRR
jgi:enoyl-CoA hydratase/carnithine racemase